MKLFPESAASQLEFDKIKVLLETHCNSEIAKQKAENLRIHTRKEFIEPQLQQTMEYKSLLQNHLYFSNDTVFNLEREIKLLSIQGAVLKGDELLQIKKLAESTGQVFRWFDSERRTAYPALAQLSARRTLKKRSLSLSMKYWMNWVM